MPKPARQTMKGAFAAMADALGTATLDTPKPATQPAPPSRLAGFADRATPGNVGKQNRSSKDAPRMANNFAAMGDAMTKSRD